MQDGLVVMKIPQAFWPDAARAWRTSWNSCLTMAKDRETRALHLSSIMIDYEDTEPFQRRKAGIWRQVMSDVKFSFCFINTFNKRHQDDSKARPAWPKMPWNVTFVLIFPSKMIMIYSKHLFPVACLHWNYKDQLALLLLQSYAVSWQGYMGLYI